MMRGLVVHPLHNSPGKHDASGAFVPEAKRFAELHGFDRVGFDNQAPKVRRRVAVETAIWEAEGLLDVVAIFAHGFRRGMQTGHTLGNVADLAECIARRSAPDVRVVLYACDTARDADRDRTDDMDLGPGGDGGFADALRDALGREGCHGGWVDAHVTAGHTTRNPHVRRFHTDGSLEGVAGGDWLVVPRSLLWRRWARSLWGKVEPEDIRLRWPLLTAEEIEAELGA